MVESNLTSGGATLNKAIFDQDEEVTAIEVPVKEISPFQKAFRDYIIQRPKLRSCHPIEDNNTHKLLIMQERLARSK